MKANRIHTSIAVLLIFVMLLTSCVSGGGGGGGNDSQQVTPRAVVTFALPFLPIEIGYDVLNEKITVSISNKIQTPLGTIGISGGVVIEEKEYEGIRTLRIEVGDKLYIYKLEKGRPYRITLPTDVYGGTTLTHTGTDETITITIPHPTDETIAELREKLRLREEEARNRTEERSQSQSGGEGSDIQSGDSPAPQEAVTDTPLPSAGSGSQPSVSEARRTVSGLYIGVLGEAEIRESDVGGFSFRLSTPRCSRAASGRARWTGEGLAYSISPIREDASTVENPVPTESMCSLSFTFSGDGLKVEEVGDKCHCNYVDVYSLN